MAHKRREGKELWRAFLRERNLVGISRGIYAPPLVRDAQGNRLSHDEWGRLWFKFCLEERVAAGEDPWEPYSRDFEKKIYSFTSYPWHVEKIMEYVSGERVLNMGTGSVPEMNLALISAGKKVTASDHSPSMLLEAMRVYEHPDLLYVLEDSTQLHERFEAGSFDSIVAVNSIIPEKRRNIDKMLQAGYRTLGENGRIVAVFPDYRCHVEARDKLRLSLRIDQKNLRVHDTIGWQCVQTPKTIERHLTDAGFTNLRIYEVPLDTEPERRTLEKLYGVVGEFTFVELMVVANKA